MLRKRGYEWCELTDEEVVGENSQVNTLRKRRERERERVLYCLYYHERALCIDESI
jgi:hypothetical protein